MCTFAKKLLSVVSCFGLFTVASAMAQQPSQQW
jgi:hypothetical protein